MQNSLRPKREHTSIRDCGSRARAVVKPEIIAITRRRFERPDSLSRSHLERLHDFPVAFAVEQDYFPANNHRRGKASPHFFLPGKLRRPNHSLARINSVTMR